MTSVALSFNEVQFEVVDRDNQPWLPSRQIGKALGYSRPDAVNKIYERNKDEFTDQMTRNVNLTLPSGEQAVRIFSLRGAHLIAMFARTKIAKDFRKWVLDILDRHVQSQPEQTLQLTSSTPADRKPLDKLVKVWAQQSGLPYAQLWTQVNAHFNLTGISDLPVEWIPDAITFVQSRIDARPKSLPASKEGDIFKALEKLNREAEEQFMQINTFTTRTQDQLNRILRDMRSKASAIPGESTEAADMLFHEMYGETNRLVQYGYQLTERVSYMLRSNMWFAGLHGM